MLHLEIYIDIVFLINFIMNLIILIIVKKIQKLKTTKFKIILASIVGSLATCFITVFNLSSLIVKFVFMYIIISSIMIIVGFSYRGIKELIKNIVVLYIVTFFLGGILNSLYYQLNIGFYFREIIMGRIYSNRNFKYYISAGIFSFAAIMIMIKTYQNYKIEIKSIYNIEMVLAGKKLNAIGFLDTGNELRDPLTNKPVIIGEYEVLESVFPECFKKTILSYYSPSMENLDLSNSKNCWYNNLKDEHLVRIKYIPYLSIGKKKGNLIGIVFDEVNIKLDKSLICNKNVIVAIYLGKLTTKEKYNIILHKKLL